MADNPPWSEGAQAARLAELTAQTSDPAKEAPLRRDVRSLGILLGRVLVEQCGERLFDTVESLRRSMIQHRERSQADSGTADLEREAKDIVASLDIESAY